MLFLETSAPAKPTNLRLLKGEVHFVCIFYKIFKLGGETSIEVAWNAVKNTDQYLLQICPLGGMEKKKKPVEKQEEKSENKAPAKPAESQSQPTDSKEKPVENKGLMVYLPLQCLRVQQILST